MEDRACTTEETKGGTGAVTSSIQSGDTQRKEPRRGPPAGCRVNKVVLMLDESKLTVVELLGKGEHLRIGDVSFAHLGPDGKVPDDELASILPFRHRHPQFLIILQGGTYRSQAEFLPHTRPNIARIALSKRLECEADEFLDLRRMGGTGSRGQYQDSWQAWVVKSQPIEQLLQQLDARRLRVMATITDEALFQEMARVQCARAEHDGDVVFVGVRSHELNLAYVSNGQVLFARRKALSENTQNNRIIASEVQRTTVFFHRKFPERRVTRAILQTEGVADEKGLASEIETSCRMTAVGGAQTGALGRDMPEKLSATQASSIEWLLEVDWKRLRKELTIEPPSRRLQRTAKQVTATIGLLVVLLSGMATAYLLSLDGVIERMRELVASSQSNYEAAQKTISTWQRTRETKRALISRLEQFRKIAGDEVDLGEMLADLANVIPDDILLEGFEISHEPASEGVPSGWKGKISLRCDVDYLHAEEPIERARTAIRTLPFLRSARTRLVIPPDSYPWSGSDQQSPSSCRFQIEFRGVGR